MAEEKENTKLNFIEALFVGGTASFVGSTVYAPFLNYATDTRFFSGYIPRTIRYAPNLALNFAFKEVFREKMFGEVDRKEAPLATFSKSFIAGGMAGFLSNTAMYSVDNAWDRLKGDIAAEKMGGTRQFTNMQDAWKKTMATEGVGGMYKGFLASSVGIIIYRGLFFGLYDTVKPLMFGDDDMLGGNLGVGYMTSIFADLASRPFHTLYSEPLMSLRGEEPYKGAMDCISRVVKTEGYKGLFKGGGGCVVRGVFGALCLAGYDRSKQHFVDWRAGKPVHIFSWW